MVFGFDLDFDGDVDAMNLALGGIIFSEMCDSEERDRKMRNLEIAGIDSFELSTMNASERRSALYDVGLDPNDYDC